MGAWRPVCRGRGEGGKAGVWQRRLAWGWQRAAAAVVVEGAHVVWWGGVGGICMLWLAGGWGGRAVMAGGIHGRWLQVGLVAVIARQTPRLAPCRDALFLRQW